MTRTPLSRKHSSLLLLLSLLSLLCQAQAPPADGAKKASPTPTPEQNQSIAPPVGPQLILSPSGGMTLLRAKESFSSLSLKDSDLHAQPPLLGEKHETKTFIRELWQVRWRPNDPIDLYVIRPVGVKNPPVALYLYGFPSDTSRFKDDGYCQRVVQGGAAAIGFVSAFTGHRSEYHPPKQWFISELPEALASTVHDVQLVLNYLDSRKDLDMSRVGIFGQGSGASIAILAASVDSRIKVLDLLDPWGDWPEWLEKSGMVPGQERAAYMQADFLKRLEPLEPVRFLPELKSRSIRIQFVDDDGEDPKLVAQKFGSAAPSTAKVIHYHDGMLFRNAVAGGGLFTWIATELKSPGDTKPESTKVTADAKRAP